MDGVLLLVLLYLVVALLSRWLGDRPLKIDEVRRALDAHGQTGRPDAYGLRLAVLPGRSFLRPVALSGGRLPGELWVGPRAMPECPPHVPRIYTRDDRFDSIAYLRGVDSRRVYALLSAEVRAALTALIERGGRLHDGVLDLPPVLQPTPEMGPDEADRRIAVLRQAGHALCRAAEVPLDDRLLDGLGGDPEPGVRHQCLLAALDGPEADAAIAIGLDDAADEVRFRAGRHAGPRGAEMLRGAASQTPLGLRADLYEHLGLNDPEALRPLLAEAIARSPSELAGPAIRVAVQAAERCDLRGLPGLARWADHADPQVGDAVVTLLSRSDDREGLIAALGSPHLLVVQTAAQALGERAELDALPRMAARLDGRDSAAHAPIDDAMTAIRARHRDRAGGLAMAAGDDGRMSVVDPGGLAVAEDA